jgi:uncharacterized membrane protein
MRALRRALVLAALAWAAALPLAALGAPRVESDPLRALLLAVYALGAAVCHQQANRSFHLAGVQLAVCARCAGVYAGAALVALVTVAGVPGGRRGRPVTVRSARLALAAAALPTALTILYEWGSGAPPANGIRSAAGLALGIAGAAVILDLVRDRVD